METSFLVILLFLLLQRFGFSNTTIMLSSSNVTCIERERQSLLALKESITDEYNRLSTWRGVECCEWHGVGCDSRNGHVVELDLRSPVPVNDTMSLNRSKLHRGELSPRLQNLKHLRYLDLSMNSFSGNIPKFLGSFKHLEYLNLSCSGLGGVVPRHLGNLSRLQYLDLKNYFNFVRYPRVDMTVPMANYTITDDLRWVSSLSSLRYLDLSGISIGKHLDWFNPVNMLPSLLTLNLASSDVSNLPSVKHVNFTSLHSLDLSNNKINSTIPVWLSNLTDLMYLNLNSNRFHGKMPYFLGMFSSLTSIDLSANPFNTLMPDPLFNLSSLVKLDLSYSKFSGPIPASLGLLLRLEDVSFQNNQLSGNIPMSLGQLSNLKSLDLSSNSLVGLLSETHLANLTNLNNLDLSFNSLDLNFSSRWVPPFQLHTLYTTSCNMGPRFPNWLQTQTNLRELVLSNSSIRDTIPEWFENIMSNIFYLDLSNNQISGKLQLFHGDGSNHTTLKYSNLTNNLLSGHLPRTDETFNLRLEVFNLSSNHFTGCIPAQLCKVKGIRVMDLSQNLFSGRLPGCLGNLIHLVGIDLADNNITGSVPSSLGSLNYLITLHFQNNRFKGDIPVSLQNLTELVTMDFGNNLLTGNIPFWIGEKLSRLRILDLHKNKFRGKIPQQLCQLSSLQYLNLANNHITGTIPRCFGNLSAMRNTTLRDYNTYANGYLYGEYILASMKGGQLLYSRTVKFLTSLDLSSNNIVGDIPNALMNLVALKSLNLSGNVLQGQIPMAIGDLKQLESLDLSLNKLSGRIPQSLISLNFLSSLNLSFNNLSGAIPVGNQMQTLDDLSIYKGNNGLCGPPVSRSCNTNDLSKNHFNEDEGKDDSEGLWFYAGMGPGFVVGLLGLLGSLHFIKSWRVTYFEMLENAYDWLIVSILLNRARLRRKFFE